MRGMRLGIAVVWVLAAGAAAWGGDWPNWRGPAYNGSSDETNLPATWSKTENVAWVTPLPGRGAATPIIWGDRVFISSLGDEEKSLLALCIDRNSGQVLWQKRVGNARDFMYKRNTMASPSPVTDGKSVWFLYGSGDLVAFDLEGKQLWARNIQKDHGSFVINYGYGASPLLYKGKLYIAVLYRDKIAPADEGPRNVVHRNSYLLCIDAQSGKELWQQTRETDAVGEGQEAYATPLPCEGAGKSMVIVAGGDYVTGHDPETGKEVWRWGDYNPKNTKWFRLVMSPVAVEDLIIAAVPQHGPLLAIRAGESGSLGQKTGLAWVREKVTPDVATPAYYQGRLYLLEDDKKRAACIDPRSGQELWQGSLETKTVFRASPTAADGKIYCISENGEVVVMAAGTEFKVLGRVAMEEGPCQASIAVAGGKLFIRTAKNLYCIGQ